MIYRIRRFNDSCWTSGSAFRSARVPHFGQNRPFRVSSCPHDEQDFGTLTAKPTFEKWKNVKLLWLLYLADILRVRLDNRSRNI